MKIFEYVVIDDFGKDYYFFFLKWGKWCVFQGNFFTAVYGRTLPYLDIVMGSGRMLGISFQFYRYGISAELFARRWR